MKLSGFYRLVGGRARKPLPDGTHLRLLTAAEVLEARAAGQRMCVDEASLALCVNACLLAKAWWRGRKPCAASGEEMLRRYPVSHIQGLAKAWAAFDREENPGFDLPEEEIDSLKKAWSTRLRSVLSGVCSERRTRCPRRRG